MRGAVRSCGGCAGVWPRFFDLVWWTRGMPTTLSEDRVEDWLAVIAGSNRRVRGLSGDAGADRRQKRRKW